MQINDTIIFRDMKVFCILIVLLNLNVFSFRVSNKYDPFITVLKREPPLVEWLLQKYNLRETGKH